MTSCTTSPAQFPLLWVTYCEEPAGGWLSLPAASVLHYDFTATCSATTRTRGVPSPARLEPNPRFGQPVPRRRARPLCWLFWIHIPRRSFAQVGSSADVPAGGLQDRRQQPRPADR